MKERDLYPSVLPLTIDHEPSIANMLRSCIVKLIRIYQLLISPLIGQCCRFYPTCSNYMIEAVETHGVCRGVWLGVKRLLKCHPLHSGGVDPVPATVQTRIDAR